MTPRCGHLGSATSFCSAQIEKRDGGTPPTAPRAWAAPPRPLLAALSCCSARLKGETWGKHPHGPAHGLRPRYPFYEKADSCQGQTWRLPRCHALSRLRPGFYPHSGEPMLWARCKLGSVFWGRCNLPHGLGPVPRGSAQSPGRGVRDLRWAAIWPSSCSLLGSYLLCRGWVGLEFGS